MTESAATPVAGFQVYKPSAAERFWKWLGFKDHRGPAPDGVDDLKWVKACTNFRLSFADRLRLLTTGKMHVCHMVHVSDDFATSKTQVSWRIVAPGQSFR